VHFNELAQGIIKAGCPAFIISCAFHFNTDGSHYRCYYFGFYYHIWMYHVVNPMMGGAQANLAAHIACGDHILLTSRITRSHGLSCCCSDWFGITDYILSRCRPLDLLCALKRLREVQTVWARRVSANSEQKGVMRWTKIYIYGIIFPGLVRLLVGSIQCHEIRTLDLMNRENISHYPGWKSNHDN